MPVTDHVRAAESSKSVASSGFHAELHSMWGPPPPLMKQAGEFLAGVGEGFGQAVGEGVKAVAEAVTHPGETVHKAVEDGKHTVHAVCDGADAASHYVADKVSHGDVSGVVHDAQKTSQSIEHILSAGIEHVSKMSAGDLGRFVGHDVLPGAIVAVAAPELAGESVALAAQGLSKVATIAKEGAALEKVATVYTSASERIAAISEKMAGLNKKMEALVHKPLVYESREIDEINVPRLRNGIVAKGEAISERFVNEVKRAQTSLNNLESHWLNTTKFSKVHNMAEEEGAEHAFAMGLWKKEAFYANPGEIKIAEVTGFKSDLVPNKDVRHSLVHEIGHLINDKFNGVNGPLSNVQEFLNVLKKDTQEVTSKVAVEARNTLKMLYPDGNTRRHEIWAESFALASDCESGIKSISRLGKLVEDGYPSAIEHLKAFREANKL